MTTKLQLRSLYREYLRQANKINHYSFREYAKRKIRNNFRCNTILPQKDIMCDLEQLKRISQLTSTYCTDNHFFKTDLKRFNLTTK